MFRSDFSSVHILLPTFHPIVDVIILSSTSALWLMFDAINMLIFILPFDLGTVWSQSLHVCFLIYLFSISMVAGHWFKILCPWRVLRHMSFYFGHWFTKRASFTKTWPYKLGFYRVNVEFTRLSTISGIGVNGVIMLVLWSKLGTILHLFLFWTKLKKI